MHEIFRFMSLRNPTGINIEEVRLKHIQFFKGIEEVQKMEINTAFLKSYEKGIEAVEKYLKTNQGFIVRSNLPYAVLKNEWKSPLNEGHKTYFELSYLLSQFNSDKGIGKNVELFTQILTLLDKLISKNIPGETAGFNVYFEDLLVLYFSSNAYPSYLRLLINLRRWHFVFNKFSFSEVKDSISNVFKPEVKESIFKAPKPDEIFDKNPVLYFLFKGKILLPKYLFTKEYKETPEPKPESGPKPTPKKPIDILPIDTNIPIKTTPTSKKPIDISPIDTNISIKNTKK